MAVEAPDISTDELREQTRAWLHDNLPPGWMEAVDAGDHEKVSALRGTARLRGVVHRASARRATPPRRGRPSTAPGCR